MKARTPLTIIACVSLILSAVFYTLKWRMHKEYCSDKSYDINNGGLTAVVQEETCDGFGASDVISVSLKRRIFGVLPLRKLVFKYDPSEFSNPMKLSWVDKSTLKIEVDRVQYIEYQSSGAFEISVIYKIGAVGNPLVKKKEP